MSQSDGIIDKTERKRRLKRLMDKGFDIRSKQLNEGYATEMATITHIIKQTDLINKQRDIKEGASSTTEVVMDALLIKMSHELLGGVIQQMRTTEFCEDTLAEIINMLAESDYEMDLPWNSVHAIVSNLSNFDKFSPPLYGSIKFKRGRKRNTDTQPKSVPQKEAKKPRRNGDALIDISSKHIERFKKINGLDDNSARRVGALYAIIIKYFVNNKKSPIPLYKLICHPEDYMHTIDNAFRVAFLVRVGSIAIANDGYDMPAIWPVGKGEKIAKPKLDPNQILLKINPRLWKDMIKRYEIDEPLLPDDDDDDERLLPNDEPLYLNGDDEC